MPTCTHPPVESRCTSGPPESPWQASTPPRYRLPAQIMSSATYPSSRYASAHRASGTYGTLAQRRYRCCPPFSWAAPQPTTTNEPWSYAVDGVSGRIGRSSGRARVITAQSEPCVATRYPGATVIAVDATAVVSPRSAAPARTLTDRTPTTQCAAVSAARGPMSEPSQVFATRTAHGNCADPAGVPPTTAPAGVPTMRTIPKAINPAIRTHD